MRTVGGISSIRDNLVNWSRYLPDRSRYRERLLWKLLRLEGGLTARSSGRPADQRSRTPRAGQRF